MAIASESRKSKLFWLRNKLTKGVKFCHLANRECIALILTVLIRGSSLKFFSEISLILCQCSAFNYQLYIQTSCSSFNSSSSCWKRWRCTKYKSQVTESIFDAEKLLTGWFKVLNKNKTNLLHPMRGVHGPLFVCAFL